MVWRRRGRWGEGGESVVTVSGLPKTHPVQRWKQVQSGGCHGGRSKREENDRLGVKIITQ